MKETVSFSKEIEFKTMLDKITSISLEHTLILNDDETIKGDLIVSGTYHETSASQIDTPFSYKIPIDVVLDSKYDLSNLTIDIDDFTYEVLDNGVLKINVDLLLDNLSIKEKEEPQESDELITYEDLFLEKEDCKKLETDKKEEAKEEKEEISIDNNSLFSNIDSKSETYKTYSIYIIRENDNLDDILKKYNVSKEELEEYNDLSDMKIGTKIIIPNSYNE